MSNDIKKREAGRRKEKKLLKRLMDDMEKAERASFTSLPPYHQDQDGQKMIRVKLWVVLVAIVAVTAMAGAAYMVPI